MEEDEFRIDISNPNNTLRPFAKCPDCNKPVVGLRMTLQAYFNYLKNEQITFGTPLKLKCKDCFNKLN